VRDGIVRRINSINLHTDGWLTKVLPKAALVCSYAQLRNGFLLVVKRSYRPRREQRATANQRGDVKGNAM